MMQCKIIADCIEAAIIVNSSVALGWTMTVNLHTVCINAYVYNLFASLTRLCETILSVDLTCRLDTCYA